MLNEFALQTQKARNENKGRSHSRYQQVRTLACLHLASLDFSGEISSVGGHITQKISVNHLSKIMTNVCGCEASNQVMTLPRHPPH